MNLTDYYGRFVKVIENYLNAGLIIDHKIEIDVRTDKLGLVRGTVKFINDSQLFFTEYIDLKYKTEKITYSYHYQDSEHNLIFRYDNAKHKSPLGFANHKHISDSVIQSEIPDIGTIFEEIFAYIELFY